MEENIWHSPVPGPPVAEFGEESTWWWERWERVNNTLAISVVLLDLLGPGLLWSHPGTLADDGGVDCWLVVVLLVVGESQGHGGERQDEDEWVHDVCCAGVWETLWTQPEQPDLLYHDVSWPRLTGAWLQPVTSALHRSELIIAWLIIVVSHYIYNKLFSADEN